MNIYDVAEISIIDQDEVVYGPVGTASVLEVDVLTENQVQLLEVLSTGPQGPPGNQNVYAQIDNPSLDSEGKIIWGEEQKGYIWIKVDA